MIHLNEQLYSKDAKLNIIKWNIQVLEEESGSYIKVEYGRLNGNLHTKTTHIKNGKNIGKANETTPLEQAILEAKSKIKSKINKGYRNIPEDQLDTLSDISTDKNGHAKPMLATLYKRGNLTDKGIVQRKYNGVRGNLIFYKNTNPNDLFDTNNIKVKLLSREGNEYTIPSIMKEQLNEFINRYKDHIDLTKIILDGEIYNHNLAREEIHSAITKHNINTYLLEFVCYDLMDDELPQIDRLKYLDGSNRKLEESKLFVSLFTDYSKFNLAKYYIVTEESKLYDLANKFIDQGFEGAILRDYYATYFHGRSKRLQKIKNVYDSEFLITDVYPAELDNYKGQPIAMFKLQTTNNQGDIDTFNCTPKASKKVRAEILFNKEQYINKMITVEYREFTVNGLPAHGVAII